LSRTFSQFCDKLKSTGEITVKSTSKFSVVTIANWEQYQSKTATSTGKTTSKTTGKQQSEPPIGSSLCCRASLAV